MAGDRARVSYDPSRKWRGLIAQQGRVTVEADWNEAATISDARDRLVTLDVVGTVGTPDSGYSVTAVVSAGTPATPTGDLTIGPGTLYLGGERLDLDAPVTYSAQPEWLDYSTDPLWVAPPVPPTTGTSYELVYLLAFEQEVSAVEDPALADVALGGPDTMARRRILQHVVRTPSQSPACGAAWSAFTGSLAGQGLQFDATSMMIESQTTLQVSFTNAPASPGPCQPVATGGYLGAENQLIRVMVASVDSGAATVVWGFDDASFLYRAQSATYDSSSDTTTITLASSPVDVYHYPALGQAVELLRDAVQLTPADPNANPPTTGDYIASAAGFVAPVSAAYDPATMQLVISGQPPAGYLEAATPQLYLRVWQSTFAPTSGQASELGGTGVAVTLTAPSGGVFHAGDFWRFALRPIQPTIVYPARYASAPQPPDGPRTWACPLAVLSWDSGAMAQTACVPPFGSLVGLTGLQSGCCTIAVSPSDIGDGGSLQALLAAYANKGPVTICLDPGTYPLSEPLLIGADNDGLTLQACGGGAVLQAPSEPGPEFTTGLIVVQGASSVTISGIELSAPLVGFTPPANSFAGLAQANQGLMATYCTGLQVAIGITVSNTSNLTIEDCVFNLPDPGTANQFGAGIYATGIMDGVAVTGCTFQTASPPQTTPFYDLTMGNQTNPPYQLTCGYLQVAIFPANDGPTDGSQLLHDAAFEGNLFEGVTVPIFALTQLGTVRINKTTVRNCYGGFWLYSATDGSGQATIDGIATGTPDAGRFFNLPDIGAAALIERSTEMATAIARVLPTTPPADPTSVAGTILAPSPVRLAQARQLLGTLYARASAAGGKPAATAAGTAPAAEPDAAAPDAAVTDPLPDFILNGGHGPVILGGGSGATILPTPTIPAADPGTSVTPRLDVSDCQVDAVIAESYSGAGLLFADLMASATASALIHGNRLRTRFPWGETVMGLSLAEVSVTGNIVANEAAYPVTPTTALPASFSLTMVVPATPLGAAALAVAGNVFIDPPALDGQVNQVAAFNTLNTVVNYSVIPSVTGISTTAGPATGPIAGGTAVTIDGSGFTAATSVSFGTVNVTAITVNSDASISVTSPPAATTTATSTVDITVTTPAGTSATSPADQFIYAPPPAPAPEPGGG
jgi:Family of unknown function (DUF6519)/IPT/TIG domain